jgi:hypothetical protein
MIAATSGESAEARARSPGSGEQHPVWRWLAWTLAGLVTVLVVSAVGVRASAGAELFATAFEALIVLPVTAVVGALIVGRRSRNAIGWMLLVSSFGWALQTWAVAVVLSVHVAGAAPARAIVWLAWLGSYGWVFSFPTVILLVPLLFPDGRLPSRRWRPVLWGALSTYGLGVLQALAPVPLEVGHEGVVVAANPAGVDALARLLPILEPVVVVVFVPTLAACVAAPVIRFRRARGVEREQIKWLLLPIALIPLVLLLSSFVVTETLGIVLGGLVMPSVPVAIGIAVLRHRLYDIDQVISRTVAYATLTVVLLGVYVGGVLGLGWVVRSVSGEPGGDLVVAASTLAVAALFGPARRRVQAVVDRRFNRARYDAQQTVEAFALRLRDEVDIETLVEDLGSVVTRNVEPRGVHVWLPPTGTPT